MQNKRVLLGMSGGTDSSVAAMLLLEQGYTVVGLTFRLWSETDGVHSLTIPDYLSDAAQLAQKLNIEHHIIDVRQYFYNEVIQYFLEGYLKGQTPNPCAKCNVVLKWKLLDEYRQTFDCQFMATGHYVQTTQLNGRAFIKRGLDPDKEQSFFLWGLSSEVIERALFPLGNLTKTQVRQIAIDKGFEPIARKAESIGVCFIKSPDYRPFLAKLLAEQGVKLEAGNFVNQSGNIIGQHQGFPFYTVGQRRGLGLYLNRALYVTKIDADKNEIHIGDNSDLFQPEMVVGGCHFNDKPHASELVVTRIRYRKQSAMSTLEFISENEVRVHFDTPEWSIAPGQTAAFYRNEVLIGGGFIK